MGVLEVVEEQQSVIVGEASPILFLSSPTPGVTWFGVVLLYALLVSFPRKSLTLCLFLVGFPVSTLFPLILFVEDRVDSLLRVAHPVISITCFN